MSGAGPGFAAAIDWQAPWLVPYRAQGEPLAQQVSAGCSVAEALNQAASAEGLPKFVPQGDLPEGEAYEAFIARTRQVPTRDNLHDFFNGLVWLHEPAAKWRLNALQGAAIAALGVGQQRGPLRDALTLFDENAALLRAPEPLVAALRQRDWPRLFLTLRPLWAQAELRLFGHALLEKLTQPRKPITAHVFVLSPGQDLTLSLQAEVLARKPYLPLPVLGVPGWWPANEAPDFYADASVFRPPAAGARNN